MSARLSDRSFQYPVGIAENMLVEAVIRVKQKQLNVGVGTERMIFNIDSAMKHFYSNDDTCFSIDVIDEILKEDFDALLNEGSKILHSIKANSFTVSRIVIVEPGVGATTWSAAYIDNSQVSKWIVSLVEWNSSVSLMKSLIQCTF
nr:reverse transcriptase domain-containing protein [Tanacetum cinerariifolium]